MQLRKVIRRHSLLLDLWSPISLEGGRMRDGEGGMRRKRRERKSVKIRVGEVCSNCSRVIDAPESMKGGSGSVENSLAYAIESTETLTKSQYELSFCQKQTVDRRDFK
jgi:hypothetical protein